jgi:hypothetical protein
VLNCYCFVMLPLHGRYTFLSIKVQVVYFFFKFSLVSKKEWYHPSKIQNAISGVLNPTFVQLFIKFSHCSSLRILLKTFLFR